MLAYTTVTEDTTSKDGNLAAIISADSAVEIARDNGVVPGLVRSVTRAVEILSLLREDSHSLTVKDAVTATGLPKTTVLRLLQTLDDAGLLWASDGKYEPGPQLLRLARIADDSWRLPSFVEDLMRDLSQECMETVNFYVRKGAKRVCISQAAGPQNLRHVVRVGDELPLWAGASAKILLAYAPEQLVAEVARNSPYGPEHLTTIKSWIEEVRNTGWAQSHAERDDDVSAVAVPAKPRNTAEVMALSLSGPSSRFTSSRVEKFVEALKRAAKTIEQ